jgi:urea transport system permease protein
MIRVFLAVLAFCLAAPIASAQGLQDLLQQNAEEVADPSRRTVGEVLDVLVESGLPEVPVFLERWQNKEVWQRESDGLFFYASETDGGFDLIDIATGEPAGTAGDGEMKNLLPNAGVRGVIGTALIEFQLSDPDIVRRTAAVEAIMRDPSEEMLEPLRASLAGETDPGMVVRKTRVERLLTASFDPDPATRVEAIGALATDTSVEARAVLSRMVTVTTEAAAAVPEGANIREMLEPGTEALSREAAYQMLVEAELAPARVTQAEIRAALEAAVADGAISDTAGLGVIAAREAAYDSIAEARGLPERVGEAAVEAALASHVFFIAYVERDPAITTAAEEALAAAQARVAGWQFADITLDALSLASIYFLAAIGLAITFGVMGVINMAHGEFIMMGAYTAFVVQLFVPDYTLSLLIALPLAFAVTFGAGVAMERLVIRWLYHRPLETLLATFGISIALQQLAKNIFGTQARPLTAPDWLNGAWQFNDVVGISYIRIAIFVLALVFLVLLLFILKRTRIGLEVRAVTQNPGMAASMGINPDRINMLTFGLGSGIAGIAGVAIGLYAQVTSEMGANYIVQSFMTVVVGGVGNVWGTLAGATLIGFLQKGIEWFNPSNTLAAQTYMILFIILFIQFRPRGIVALRGRAAGG